jgi:hypothetical protein
MLPSLFVRLAHNGVARILSRESDRIPSFPLAYWNHWVGKNSFAKFDAISRKIVFANRPNKGDAWIAVANTSTSQEKLLSCSSEKFRR